MSTIKIVLRAKAITDTSAQRAELPLTIRITKDRKTSFIYTGYRVKAGDWDLKNQQVKKSHPNAARLNNFLIKMLAEVTNACLQSETDNNYVTAYTVKQKVKPRHTQTFFPQADLYLEQLKKAGKWNRYNSDKPRFKQFKKFLGTSEFPFSEINPTLLKRFLAWLTYDENGKPRAERTIINYLVPIRTVINLAIAEGIADQRHYPFGKRKVTIKFPESKKLGLSMEEIRKIEQLDLSENRPEDHARNVWLFSFYLAGIRISDTFRLRWSDIEGERLTYSMGKNNKVDSLKIPEKANAILAKYKRENPRHDLVFPDLEGLEDFNDNFKVDARIAQKAKRLNELLVKIAQKCEITKPLTNHISRHSFGNVSGKRIPVQILQKLYRHTHISTTMNYQGNFIHDDVDNALDAVINMNE
ncbi:MAG: site-specific integrase [Sediminibacterium sp.]